MYDIEKPDLDELIHFGVLGMKWGVHKKKEKAYRQKLSNIVKRQSEGSSGSDYKRFEYRNQSLAARSFKMAARMAGSMVVADVITGNIHDYSRMTKKDIAKRVTRLVGSTAINVAVEDALAKSASKRYKNDGKKVKGTNRPFYRLSKEDLIEIGISTAYRATKIATFMAGVKVARSRREKAKNEEIFKSWGKNLLEEKVADVTLSKEEYSFK